MKLTKVYLFMLAGMFSTMGFAQFNYGEALQKSLFFYEAQQSGPLPAWNRVSWRGDSAVNDGADVGLDLTGGWYDAGDHVKFNFPMAYTVTTLAWGAIEFNGAYARSGQLDIIKRNLRFVTDYFLKCHTGPNELWGQVAAGGVDHSFWGPAEVNPTVRESFKISGANGGSDLAGETAAALSAVSILLKDDDPVYSARLLSSAIELYDYADRVRVAYSNSITDAAGFYRSFSNFEDEIVWGAAWLYRATGDTTYLTKAEAEYDNMQREGQSTIAKYKEAFSWDDKAYGSYVLLAQLTGNTKYKQDAERNLDWWTGVGVNGDTVPKTPGGLPHIRQWGTLRYANNEAFLALVYSEKVSTSATQQQAYRNYAKFMADYTLGDNPINRSFMVGFGNNPANRPHHRGEHGGWTNNCSGVPLESSHTLYGAVVGGPKSPANDSFVDDRCEFIANEVACDYNAGITGVLAWMYDNFGGTPLANFPVDEVPSRAEIRSWSKFNSNNAFGSTIKVLLQNRTAWPARVTDKLSFRYYFDIAEGVAAGKTIADYDVQFNSIGSTSTATVESAGGSLYYVEVTNIPSISPIGDPQFRNEAQINIRVANGVPYDITNDPSAAGINSAAETESPNIPVYDNGVLVFGSEPGDVIITNRRPVANFTASAINGVEPLTVNFTNSSTDADGDPLTYSWNLGNATTSVVANPSATYSAGTYTVTLIANDGELNSTPKTQTITVNVAPPPSDGGTITGGPFNFVVGDGTPDNVSGITLTGNRGANSTWVVTDANNNILGLPPTLVALEGNDFDGAGEGVCLIWHLSYENGLTGLAVGQNVSGLNGVYDLSNSITVNRSTTIPDPLPEGGTITGGPFTFTVGDGTPDNVSGITLTGNTGTNSTWVVTDANNNILGLPPTLAALEANNFDGAGEGVCLIWHLSYEDGLTGLTAGQNVSGLNGVYDLSNSITVNREPEVIITPPNGDCSFGAPSASPIPSTYEFYSNAYVLGAGGPDLSNLNGFNISWDLSNNGLWNIAIQTTNGQPGYYVNLSPGTTNTLASAQPTLTFSGSGITGFDGTYDVVKDGVNLVLVSQVGGYTIYLTSGAAPNCTQTSAKVIADTKITIYPNPAKDVVNVQSSASNSKFILLNMGGKVIESLNSAGEEVTFNVSDLNSGIYILQEFDGDRLVNVEKIIVN